jgi:hypothetical protein
MLYCREASWAPGLMRSAASHSLGGCHPSHGRGLHDRSWAQAIGPVGSKPLPSLLRGLLRSCAAADPLSRMYSRMAGLA